MTKKVQLSLVLFTALYLVFELAFSARLLDVLGSRYNEDIHGIEIYGRMFSGIALSLLFFKRIFSSKYDLSTRALTMLVTVTVSICFMSFAQEQLIAYIKSHYSIEEKNNLTYLSLSSGLVASNEIQLNGLPEEVTQTSPNAFKAFVALYPYLYQFQDQQKAFTPVIKDKILTYQVTTSCDLRQQDSDRTKPGQHYECLGDLSHFHRALWLPAREKFIESINSEISSYQDKTSASSAKQAAEQGWQDYLKEVQSRTSRGVHEANRHAFYRNAIREAVVNRLKPYLSKNWNIEDKAAFEAAFASQYIATVRTEAHNLFKASMPTPITTQWVFEQPETQWRINESFGLVHGADKNLIMDSINKRIVEDQRKVDLANFITFKYNALNERDSAKNYEHLVRFYKNKVKPKEVKQKDLSSENVRNTNYYDKYLDRMVIPFVALLFSLSGGFLHLVKFTYLATSLFTQRMAIKVSAASFTLLCLIIGPFMVSNAITRSEAFLKVIGQHQQEQALAIKWMINAQNIVYPINDTLRKRVLFGMQFNSLKT